MLSSFAFFSVCLLKDKTQREQTSSCDRGNAFAAIHATQHIAAIFFVFFVRRWCKETKNSETLVTSLATCVALRVLVTHIYCVHKGGSDTRGLGKHSCLRQVRRPVVVALSWF